MISIYKEYIVLLFVSFRVLFCLFFDTNTHLLFLFLLFETEAGGFFCLFFVFDESKKVALCIIFFNSEKFSAEN